MPKPKKGQGVGQTIGGVLVGFDHQIFRSTPPPHELIQKGTRMPAVPADDGGTLSIELPEDRSITEPDESDRRPPR